MVLIAISHVALPWADQQNWGPFYVWQLFTGLSKQANYDIEMRRENKNFFLTQGNIFYDQPSEKHKKVLLWFRAQAMNSPGFSKEAVIKDIRSILEGDGIEFMGLCEIQGRLSTYMLMDEGEKREHCGKVL